MAHLVSAQDLTWLKSRCLPGLLSNLRDGVLFQAHSSCWLNSVHFIYRTKTCVSLLYVFQGTVLSS